MVHSGYIFYLNNDIKIVFQEDIKNWVLYLLWKFHEDIVDLSFG